MKPNITGCVLVAWAAAVALGGEAGSRGMEAESAPGRLAAGPADEALAATSAALKALPRESRLCLWHVPLPCGPCQIAVGPKTTFLLIEAYAAGLAAPGLTGPQRDAGSICANRYSSDCMMAILAVDLDSGQVLWKAGMNGLADVVADPRDDRLYVLGDDLLILDGRTGALIERHRLDPDKDGTVSGLSVGGRLWITPRAKGGRAGRVKLYDPARRRTVEIDMRCRRCLLGDESGFLLRTDKGRWACEDLRTGQEKWSFSHPGSLPLHPPVPGARRVLFSAGRGYQKGQVCCLANDGKVVWRADVPWGLWDDVLDPSSRDLYPHDVRSAATFHQEHVAVVDGRGEIHILDAATGERLSALWPRGRPVRSPLRHGASMVFFLTTGLQAVPLRQVLGGSPDDERHLLVGRAAALRRLGRAEEAMDVTARVLTHDQTFAPAWAERAEACRQLGQDLEECYSRCRHAALSGRDGEPELRRRWGLVRLIDLGSRPAWQLVSNGPHIFAGTQSGNLWQVDAGSLRAARVRRLDREIRWLSGGFVLRASDASSSVNTQTVSLPRADAPMEPDGAPEQWSRRSGYDGRAVRHAGRYYRPLKGGKVRIWDGRNISIHQPQVEGIESWEIALTPAGPIGYGTGGVYELGEHLQPVQRMFEIRVGRVSPDRARVLLLRATEEAMGLVVASTEGAALQVYAIQGWRKLHDVPLGRYVSAQAEQPGLIILGGGFLFSDRQLVWASAEQTRRPWRFGPPLERTSTPAWGDRWRYFGDPIVWGDYLFAAARDGCIYVFNTEAIGRRPR